MILMMFVLLVPASAQVSAPPNDSLSGYLQFEDSSPASCLITYLPPFFFQHEIELKSFIRSKKFRLLRKEFGDRRAIDVIFVHAMNLTNNNTAVALFLSMLACFDHRTVGLRIPVFNLFFPLTNESEDEYNRRVANLPSRLFSDSPPDSNGDRDKVQHFFGSAFLSFIFESRESANRFGDFIEEGEEAIIVDGVNDERDKSANREGQRFGVALLDDNHRYPSTYLRKSLKKVGMSFDNSHCIGVW
jgi:hypothetical protein